MALSCSWGLAPLLAATALLMPALPLCAADAPSSIDSELLRTYDGDLNAPGALIFTPPPGWALADPKELPSAVKCMVVGKGRGPFPPSINLGTENYGGTLRQYLKRVRVINDAQGALWRDLGTIRTEAGEASLSQVDTTTEWGEVRMMHVILAREGVIYIVTAAALKEEFPDLYKLFFNAFHSLRFNPTSSPPLPEFSATRKAELKQRENRVRRGWSALKCHREGEREELFLSERFQQEYWLPFTKILEEKYGDMPLQWRASILEELKAECLLRPTDRDRASLSR